MQLSVYAAYCIPAAPEEMHGEFVKQPTKRLYQAKTWRLHISKENLLYGSVQSPLE